MKSYRSSASAGLKVGLRPEAFSQFNSSLLIFAQSCRVMKGGLQGYAPSLKNIFDADVTFVDSLTDADIDLTFDWPFPQLFQTKAGLFIGAKEGLYRVESDGKLYTFGTGSVQHPWTCADIGLYPMFSCSDKLVYRDPITEAYVVI